MENEALNIDNEIETAVSATVKNDAVEEAEGEKAHVDAVDGDADLEKDAGETDGVDKELKTVRKALEKRNRYINNQRQRIRALEDQMQKMQQSFAQNNQKAAPNMEQYDSAIDYIKADQAHVLEQKFSEQRQQQQLEMLRQQKEAVLAEQTQMLERQAVELSQSNPDFQKVISENTQVFSAMPDHINEMMTNLDDGLAAAYALAKEGRLASLYSMPPHIAAAHLVQAEIRGQQYLQQAAKPTKEPPKPIGSLKGAGKASTKPLGQMTPDELGKWLSS